MLYVDNTTLRQLLEVRARDDEDGAFCFFENETITFGALENCVNRLANGLAKIGLRAGDRVAVMLQNHPDHIYTLYALAKLGVVSVPVNVNLKGESLNLLFDLSDPRAIIADRTYSDSIREALPRSCSIELLVWRGEGYSIDIPVRNSTTLDDLSANLLVGPPPYPGPGPDDTLLLSYTSGTTGMPKGAPLTDRMWRAAPPGVLSRVMSAPAK